MNIKPKKNQEYNNDICFSCRNCYNSKDNNESELYRLRCLERLVIAASRGDITDKQYEESKRKCVECKMFKDGLLMYEEDGPLCNDKVISSIPSEDVDDGIFKIRPETRKKLILASSMFCAPAYKVMDLEKPKYKDYNPEPKKDYFPDPKETADIKKEEDRLNAQFLDPENHFNYVNDEKLDEFRKKMMNK